MGSTVQLEYPGKSVVIGNTNGEIENITGNSSLQQLSAIWVSFPEQFHTGERFSRNCSVGETRNSTVNVLINRTMFSGNHLARNAFSYLFLHA